MSSRLRNAITFGTDPFDSTHRFETSWLLSPWTLFSVRATISLYAFFVLFFSLGWEGTHLSAGGALVAGHSFSYFTVLTYWGLAFYFLTSAVHTFAFARKATAPLDAFPRPLQALHSLFYTTITTFPFIVTIVFWCLIYPGTWFPYRFDAWTNVSEHVLNSAFALFEIIFARTDPPPFIHLVWLIIILALYLAVAYITHATQGWFVYAFLNPAHGPALAGYIVGIAVGALVIFSLVNGLIRLRKWLTEVKFPRTGRLRAGDKASEPGSEQPVELENGLRSTHPEVENK